MRKESESERKGVAFVCVACVAFVCVACACGVCARAYAARARVCMCMCMCMCVCVCVGRGRAPVPVIVLWALGWSIPFGPLGRNPPGLSYMCEVVVT